MIILLSSKSHYSDCLINSFGAIPKPRFTFASSHSSSRLWPHFVSDLSSIKYSYSKDILSFSSPKSSFSLIHQVHYHSKSKSKSLARDPKFCRLFKVHSSWRFQQRFWLFRRKALTWEGQHFKCLWSVTPHIVLDAKSPDLVDFKVPETKFWFLSQFFLEFINFLTSIYVSEPYQSIAIICAFTSSKLRLIRTALWYPYHPNHHSISLNVDFNAILFSIDSLSPKER